MSELSELELYRRMMHSIEEAKNCAKGIAQHRSDSRWLGVAQGLEMMFQNVGILAMGRSMSHQESTVLLDKREAQAGDRAAQQRFRERVEAAQNDYKTGH